MIDINCRYYKMVLLTTNILVKLMLLFRVYCMRTYTHILYMECWKEPQGDLDVTSLHDLVNKVEIITQKKTYSHRPTLSCGGESRQWVSSIM